METQIRTPPLLTKLHLQTPEFSNFLTDQNPASSNNHNTQQQSKTPIKANDKALRKMNAPCLNLKVEFRKAHSFEIKTQ